ncbi:hypothetical protein RV18_GL000661 [Enterococcus termitis]|nr:hypothetical protein RV18_GL000661 [Enterococcus termitis]
MTREITEEGLFFERELLYVAKNRVTRERGSVLNDSELTLMKQHLENLNPYSDEVEEIRLDGDPRVASTFFETKMNQVANDELPQVIEEPIVQEQLVENNSATPNQRKIDYFKGAFPSNSHFRFAWNGGEDITTVYLDLSFGKLSSTFPAIEGYSGVFTVVENPKESREVHFLNRVLITRSKEELREIFQDMANNTGETTSFENELFRLMREKGIENNGLGRNSKELTFSRLVEYKKYLKTVYPEENTNSGDVELSLVPLAANPEIKIGIMDFVQDEATYLLFRNNFHSGTISEKTNFLLEKAFAVVEDVSQEKMYEFEQFSTITVRNMDEFRQFVEDTSKEISLDALLFERQLILKTKDINSRIPGTSISDMNLSILERHLANLDLSNDSLNALDIEVENEPLLVISSLKNEQEFTIAQFDKFYLKFIDGEHSADIYTLDDFYYGYIDFKIGSPEALVSLKSQDDRIGYLTIIEKNHFSHGHQEMNFPKIPWVIERLNESVPKINSKYLSEEGRKYRESIKGTAEKEHNEEESSEEMSLFDFEYDAALESNQTDNNPMSETLLVSKNYYSSDDTLYQNGKKAKAQDNLIALELLDSLEKQQQQATKEDQSVLAKYSGWGGIPEIFDEELSNWKDERNRLKNLLSDQEYAGVRSTVLTAFYTDPKLIRTMYQFAENFGDFSKGNILDPAMGTGNFFQALPDNLKSANLTGIELDGLTGRLAKQLYPDANVSIAGFEKVKLKEKMDLVIGNFPFNNIKVLDQQYDKYNFVVHDYFMAKSINSLNQKGVLLFITSAGSMDKKDMRAREFLAKRANFIGAVRLPKTAFKQSAGTEVISDILIFQKKTMKEMMAEYQEPNWVNSREHPEFLGLFMNEYFIEHPEQILGEIRVKNFQGQTLDVVPPSDQDLIKEVNEAFNRVLKDQTIEKIEIKEKSSHLLPEVLVEITVPEETKQYSFFKVGSRTFYHTVDGEFEEYKGTMNQTRIKLMIPVREAVSEVLTLQQYDYEESELKEKLKILNETYDAFVDKCGYMNDPVNMRILRADNKYPLLVSLEKETEDGYIKQPIFYQATVRPKQMIHTVSKAIDAVQISMMRRRNIDFEYVQELYPDHTFKEIIEELGSEIYLNPSKLRSFDTLPEENLNAWEIADEFLTGNVKEKLDRSISIRDAVKNADLLKQIDKGIEDLKKAQPERLLEGDIKFQIGSPWIPLRFYDEFMHDLFETPEYMTKGKFRIRVDYLDHNASWRVLEKGKNGNSVLVTEKFGTDRINGYEILEASLNLQKATIKDRVVDGDTVRYVLNAKETMIARGKQEDIEYEFQKWLFQDQARSRELLDIYNDRFNTNRPRKYNGENLTFDEMNLQVELRPHQKDVIARILYSGKALMAHEVGAGKTAAMLSAGMYLKQNGLVNKPLYVVPNHLTEQWGKEILTFYPNANILITTKKDFEKQNRRAFVSRIATGNYDAVIIGHSQFERIPLSEERQRAILNSQIKDALSIIAELKAADAEKWSIKQIERFKKGLETKLEKLANESKKDDVITFEELGVDCLFVDEAHAYKNLFIYTKMQNVAGVGKSNSQRASDMLSKVRYIQEMNDGKNVVFATGTPVSNSMSELYVMQYFLQPEELKQRGLNSFDSWASTFGQVTSTLEITPEGSGYRIRDRFSKFHNLPELMTMFHQVADIQTADMLKLPVPELETGKVQTIVTERSLYQERKMAEFVTRSEDIRNGHVDPSDDNMLKLTNEAKLMAIDSRLIDEEQVRDPESKLSICSEKVFSVWERTKPTNSTQIIFSDSGTPKPGKFNVYQEIKDQLLSKGVPENEIAFVHDAKTDKQRDDLFEKVRNGEVRVIIGSTQKLGTGTNIQNKLIAAHHIDCPWKPSDLTQREGRILRQGNENETVEIFRYVTKGTFDSYLWQIQEQKLTYIAQVMNGSNINRSMDDLDETVLSAAEVKAIATDNPLLAEKMGIDNEVTRLQLIRSQWANARSRMDKNIRETYPNKLAYLDEQLKKYSADLSVINSNPQQEFFMEIDGKQIDNREDAFIQINAFSQLTGNDLNKEKGSAEIKIGSYRGLDVYLEKTTMREDTLSLRGESSYRTKFTPDTKTGNITRLINLVNHINDRINDTNDEIRDTKLQMEVAQRELEAPFPQQEELDQYLKEQSTINKQIELQTLESESEEERYEVEYDMEDEQEHVMGI